MSENDLKRKGTFFSKNQMLICRDKQIDLSVPVVMGILNITPDSFYDGGYHFNKDKALKQTEAMVSEGAGIIDIGAVSTRPGAKEIPVEQELERLLPVLKAVRITFPEIPVSVDTYRSDVALKAIEHGADIINDISGGRFDKDMFRVVAATDLAYIMMHIQGNPMTMQINPYYENVVEDIFCFFKEQAGRMEKLHFSNIIVDPGFGFGKTVEHNYRILACLGRFHELGYPVMAGLSRKSMINKMLGIHSSGALNGTTVLNTIAILNKANILRVHDVKPAIEAVKLCSVYKQMKQG